jgi:hypothetical protein
MGEALKIKDELSAEALRRGSTAGEGRAEAARLAGMERQALRDAVINCNADGLAGLHDGPRGRLRRRLEHGEEAWGPLSGPAPYRA